MRPVSPLCGTAGIRKAPGPPEANLSVLAGRRADLAEDERQYKLCRAFDSQTATFARSGGGGSSPARKLCFQRRGKHSAWLSAPHLAAAPGGGFAGRSPHPLPLERRSQQRKKIENGMLP